MSSAIAKAIERYVDEVLKVVSARASAETRLAAAAAQQMIEKGHGKNAASLAAQITSECFRRSLWKQS